MPTPTFTMRLSRDTQDTLAELSKLYGSPNKRAFTREMIESIISGDEKKLGDFLGKLMTKIAGQLAFEFAQKASKVPEVPMVPVVSKVPKVRKMRKASKKGARQ